MRLTDRPGLTLILLAPSRDAADFTLHGVRVLRSSNRRAVLQAPSIPTPRLTAAEKASGLPAAHQKTRWSFDTVKRGTKALLREADGSIHSGIVERGYGPRLSIRELLRFRPPDEDAAPSADAEATPEPPA